MDLDLAYEMFVMQQRTIGLSFDETARTLREGGIFQQEVLDQIMERVRRKAAQNRILDTPRGVSRKRTEEEIRDKDWYVGPSSGDEYWPRLRNKLENSSVRDVVDDIDTASTKVVAHLAEPTIHNLKKRGLVVGYVQSGKTANYTAVMAKAADAGYKLFIVLAGLHNNLRRQTQVRVAEDLGTDAWHEWTTATNDFSYEAGATAILRRDIRSLAVVKKNAKRLQNLLDWLRDVPENVRVETPILLIDDEADQATPNTAKLSEDRRGINRLVSEILSEIRTGTYLGYTATPFANVFMDPEDEEELYPADFIIDLPRPEAYFGAERLFGREPLHEHDEPEDGLDMMRDIDDADGLKPPSDEELRAIFDPALPCSLRDAVTWFVVATAIRRARGQQKAHSSMLVHTTHYVAPHFAMKRALDELLDEYRELRESGDFTVFQNSFNREARRADQVATVELPRWEEVLPFISKVLGDVRVVVDNGSSTDRLDYSSKAGGEPKPETVIAVGGGTLSRGLTLEGLVVSYFTRTSNTYDTLLQMGRWFGFRPGYEDLPRIWMQRSLQEEFRFLALVEEEIRQDMRYLEEMNRTPRELGIRVRAHPGRLAIVARNKMGRAEQIRVTYSGQRLQTFIFDELNTDVGQSGVGSLDHNLRLTRNFLAEIQEEGCVEKIEGHERWIVRDVGSAEVARFIEAYSFHESQSTMRAGDMAGWIRSSAAANKWNVVIMGKTPASDDRGRTDKFIELGVGSMVPLVTRTPLTSASVRPGVANIKALMSHDDWFIDLDPKIRDRHTKEERREPRRLREIHAGGRGVVVIYPIDKASKPRGLSKSTNTRRQMEAPQHIIGLGVIFPNIDRTDTAASGDYYSVTADWEPEVVDDDDETQALLEGGVYDD